MIGLTLHNCDTPCILQDWSISLLSVCALCFSFEQTRFLPEFGGGIHQPLSVAAVGDYTEGTAGSLLCCTGKAAEVLQALHFHWHDSLRFETLSLEENATLAKRTCVLCALANTDLHLLSDWQQFCCIGAMYERDSQSTMHLSGSFNICSWALGLSTLSTEGNIVSAQTTHLKG